MENLIKTLVAILSLCVCSLRVGAQVNFTLSSSPAVGNQPTYIAAADVNGDGFIDLIAVNNSGTGTYSVLTNNGNGRFVLSSSPASAPNANTVLALDVNGDGKPDLISDDYYDDIIVVATNDGSGGFETSSTESTGIYPIGIAATNLNGDGKLELICVNSAQQDSTVSVLTNNGSGGFASSGKYPVGSNPWSVFPSDVNGDGKLDLVTADYGSSTVTVLTNNGSGGFATSGTYAVGTNPRHAIVVDINADGHPDIITANYSDNTISVLTNNGVGRFVPSAVYSVGNNPDFVAAADVNGDGAVDLVVANFGSSTLSVLTNNGVGVFVTAGTFAVGSGPRAVVAVDVNGDGKVDLCTANQGSASVTILTNGTVFPPSIPQITTQPVGQTNVIGSTASFTVRASGTSPLYYQWRFNGTNISSATSTNLTLSNLSTNQAGIYDVVVTNTFGSITSNPAMLGVLFIGVEVNGQLVTGTASALSPATITLEGGYPSGYIFYTLDGSTPTTSSALYTAPFALTNSAVINTLGMSSDFSQQAPGAPVTVQILPAYTLQTSIVGSGTLSTNPPGGVYPSNSVVTLTATPSAHWAFAGWAGDTNGTQNPLSVTMNGPRNIQATFVQTAFPLTLTTPGGGFVLANGLSIAPSTYFAAGTVVSLVAGSSSGFSFLGWQGSINSTNNPYSLVMNQTNVIQGIFGAYATTNPVSGGNPLGGNIILSLTNPVPYGASLAASAVPNPGNYFGGWSGILNGTITPSRVTVTVTNLGFGAYFYTLPAGKFSVAPVVNGNGFVTVTGQKAYYNSNDMVQLIESPNAGSYFFGWTGSATGTGSSVTVQVTNNMIIQANFGVGPSVGIAPPSQTVFAGSNSTLNASALGYGPVTYQWQSTNGAISKATNSFLVISNIQPASAGNYWVVISNSLGMATSGVALVTVIGGPTITNPPTPVSVTVGHAASYAVGAYGAPILAYQWQFNGANLSGATNTWLTISNAFPSSAGQYRVTVTNAWGSVTSSPVALTVVPLTIAVPAKVVGGQFQITFDTAMGINYEVDYSTDMLNWIPWLTLGGTGQPLTLRDPTIRVNPERFYRIVLAPQ